MALISGLEVLGVILIFVQPMPDRKVVWRIPDVLEGIQWMVNDFFFNARYCESLVHVCYPF